jgi:hypothetical protein
MRFRTLQSNQSIRANRERSPSGQDPRSQAKVGGVLAIFWLLTLHLFWAAPVKGHEETRPEYELKALYCYRFLSYTEWPTEAFGTQEDTITIGILGRDPFGSYFDSLEGRSLGDRRLVVKRFRRGSSPEALSDCQLLFLSSSLKGRIRATLESLADRPVLTVSDVDNFAEMGGMVELFTEGEHIRFEINTGAATRVGIRLRSRLLRLASRIIDGGQS